MTGRRFASALVAVGLAGAACSSSGSGGSAGAGGGAVAGGGGGRAAGQGGASGANGGSAGGVAGGAGGGSSGAGAAGRSDAGPPNDANHEDAAMTTQVIPALRDGRYGFVHDDVTFEVDPRVGGRITTFALGGQNLLTGAAVEPDNWGSTFWPSPQSVWNWPPPAEIDNAGYGAVVDGDTLVLAGQPSPRAGNLSGSKRFRLDAVAGAVRIEYALKNTGGATTKVAPWEITRVFPGNLTLFALGPGGIHPAGANFDAVSTETRDGVVWFAYDAAKITKSQKLFADGKGWLAHVDRAHRLLFVKAWDDAPDSARAPGESEIEIFVDGDKRYVELEQQGAYADVAANAEQRWAVRWYLRPIPSGTSLEVGSAALIEQISAIVR